MFSHGAVPKDVTCWIHTFVYGNIHFRHPEAANRTDSVPNVNNVCEKTGTAHLELWLWTLMTFSFAFLFSTMQPRVAMAVLNQCLEGIF